MKISKIIALFVCGLVLLNCMGCSKTNEKSIDNSNTNSESQAAEEYKLKPNLTFYVLKDEYLENNDVNNPNISQLIRIFICYDGVKNSIYPDTVSLALDKVNTIEEFKMKLISDSPKALKLPPKTIVSNKVLNQWKSQNYDDSNSYSDESPKGLTYSKI